MHLHSTRSHAKLVLADAAGRSASEFVAVVGSCNWLYSGFNRVETSVVLRDPHAVAMVAQEIAELAFDVAKSSTISADLTAVARTLRTHAAPTGPAKIRIVKGDDHQELMRLARETATRAIMVGGDRLGLAAEARTIIPMMAAAERSVEGTICYSKPSGPVTARDARELHKVAASAKVQDYRVHRMTTARAKSLNTIDGAQNGSQPRSKGPARSTLHDEIVTLRQVLKTAIRHNWLSVLHDFSPPYRTQGKIVHRPWFSPEEYKQLYKATRQYAHDSQKKTWQWNAEQVHDYVLFLANTGLRPDGAKNLQHRDVTIARPGDRRSHS